jgi:hypothetical protein
VELGIRYLPRGENGPLDEVFQQISAYVKVPRYLRCLVRWLDEQMLLFSDDHLPDSAFAV